MIHSELKNKMKKINLPVFSVVVLPSGHQSELRLRKWIEGQIGVAQFRGSIPNIPGQARSRGTIGRGTSKAHSLTFTKSMVFGKACNLRRTGRF